MVEKSYDEELGYRLATLRRNLSITQEYLAEILQHDQTYVSKVETGKRQLSVFDYVSWCKALNLSSDDMIQLLNVNYKP